MLHILAMFFCFSLFVVMGIIGDWGLTTPAIRERQMRKVLCTAVAGILFLGAVTLFGWWANSIFNPGLPAAPGWVVWVLVAFFAAFYGMLFFADRIRFWLGIDDYEKLSFAFANQMYAALDSKNITAIPEHFTEALHLARRMLRFARPHGGGDLHQRTDKLVDRLAETMRLISCRGPEDTQRRWALGRYHPMEHHSERRTITFRTPDGGELEIPECMAPADCRDPDLGHGMLGLSYEGHSVTFMPEPPAFKAWGDRVVTDIAQSGGLRVPN